MSVSKDLTYSPSLYGRLGACQPVHLDFLVSKYHNYHKMSAYIVKCSVCMSMHINTNVCVLHRLNALCSPCTRYSESMRSPCVHLYSHVMHSPLHVIMRTSSSLLSTKQHWPFTRSPCFCQGVHAYRPW